MMSYLGCYMHVSRVVWQLAKGPIPPGMIICHRCDVPACVNLEHLWLGTHKDNARDRHAKGRDWQSKRTHCPRGHEYVPDNIVYRTNRTSRACKTCRRMYTRMKGGWPKELAETTPALPIGVKRMHL